MIPKECSSQPMNKIENRQNEKLSLEVSEVSEYYTNKLLQLALNVRFLIFFCFIFLKSVSTHKTDPFGDLHELT